MVFYEKRDVRERGKQSARERRETRDERDERDAEGRTLSLYNLLKFWKKIGVSLLSLLRVSIAKRDVLCFWKDDEKRVTKNAKRRRRQQQ